MKPGEEISEEAAEVLLKAVERQGKVEKLSNSELSQVLVDLTELHRYDSYFFHVLMEAAERLDPEGFKEA